MKSITKILMTCFFSLFLGISISNAQVDTTILHTFDSTVEDWTIAGDGTALEWQRDAGISGGAICSTDLLEGIVWYFQAPYQGDMSEWYGQVLKFSLKQRSSTLEWIDDYDVLLVNNNTGETLVYDNPVDPPRNGEAIAYSIKFSESDTWLNRHTGQQATKSELISVLSTLSSLQIRGEYINGSDSACLDNVEIKPIQIDWVHNMGCEGLLPSRMLLGYEGQVLINPPNRLRAAPSINGEILSEIPINEPFIVNNGPVCADGFAWWNINHKGISGWTAEGNQDTYWIEPLIDLPSSDLATVFNIAYGMNGSWRSGGATVRFNTTATARYEDDNGRVIISQFADNTLSGVWVEDHSQQQCATEVDGSYYWGNITLTPNQDFSMFMGVWGYCDDPQTSLWNTQYSDLDFQLVIDSTYNSGKIVITHIDYQNLYGYWISSSSQQICEESIDGSRHWGHFIFTPIQSFSSFIGVSGSCHAEPTDVWNGQALP